MKNVPAQALSELKVNDAINCEPTLPLCKHHFFFIKNKEINTQTKELKYLDLTAFLEVLRNDPDLSSIPAVNIPQIFQSLFVSTGCDYISFFSEMGKASFYRYFYQHAEFISSGNSFPGTLADTGLTNNQFETGFLAFLRLVVSVYFKKHKSGFSQSTPRSHYSTFKKNLD